MDKQEMREKIILTVKESMANSADFSKEDILFLDSNDVDHIAEECADELIKAGFINGADFVEYLIKKYYFVHQIGLRKALQEYLKGE